MLIPEVIGCRLIGKPRPGVTSTDIVLTVTQTLRRHKVVDKFVEYFGPGRRRALTPRPRHDRQHDARSTARPWASFRSTPRRCAICASPAATKRRSRWSRPMRRRRACGAMRARRAARIHAHRRDRSFGGRAERLGTAPAAGTGAAARSAGRFHERCFRRKAPQRKLEGRRRRHRRDHELHQHIESVGHDRRRPARAQRRRARPARRSRWVKTSLSPGLARRRRLSRSERPAGVARRARLPARPASAA